MTGSPVSSDVRVAMSDGVELSARVWRVHGGPPRPAVLECHPYRKNDAMVFDAARHRETAVCGYVSVQLDLRGSGDSDGVLADEYLPREQADIVEVIGWLRDQPWCDGTVGLYGHSWGGIAALQVAALAPPGLAAVIAVGATDDRYALDVHYHGGAVLATDMSSWATTMLAYNARPPDPTTYGSGWREAWQQRLEHVQPWLGTWLEHQRADSYWRHGSVGLDPDAIDCPVLLVSGFADAYRDAVPRLLAARRRGVTRAILGPWGHAYPDHATPGPTHDFVHEAVRWWDAWLGHQPTRAVNEPAVRAFLQDALRPGEVAATRTGRWLGLDSLGATTDVVPLDAEGPPTMISTPLRPAVVAPVFFSAGVDERWALDQRAEDERAATFSTPVTERDLAILGVPSVELDVAAPDGDVLVIVRLADVWPDGASRLLARGVLNLRHPTGAASTSRVRIELTSTSVLLPAGHRLRVAVSTNAWPFIWPLPRLARLRVVPGVVALRLPLVDAATLPTTPAPVPDWAPALSFGPPIASPEPSLAASDGCVDEVRRSSGYPASVTVTDTGTTYVDAGTDVLRLTGDDALGASAHCARRVVMGGAGWSVEIDAETTMTADQHDFRTAARLVARLDGSEVFAREWNDVIARNGG